MTFDLPVPMTATLTFEVLGQLVPPIAETVPYKASLVPIRWTGGHLTTSIQPSLVTGRRQEAASGVAYEVKAMALNQTTLKALRNELASLLTKRRDIDVMIHSVQAVLSRFADSSRATNGTTTAGDPVSRTSPMVKRHCVKRGELRRCMLDILGSASPLSSARIASQLADRGIRIGGRTDLRHRVTKELARMRHAGLLDRRATGEYQIATRIAEAKFEPGTSAPADGESLQTGAP